MALAPRRSPRVQITFLRMWRIVVLLRCQPHTVNSLAVKLSVCPRTIRRDLATLQAIPLPITHRFTSRKGVRASERDTWSCGDIPEWSRIVVLDPAVAGTVGAGTPPQFAS